MRINHVRKLVDQYIELYRNLWKRGAFNRDTNILEDSGLDRDNRLVLVDFTEVVFSREEANQYLENNREFIPRFHFRIFAEMTSREDLEYYTDSMRRLYAEFLSPEGQALWGTEPGWPVSLPEHTLQTQDFTANSPLKTAYNKWNLMMENIVRRSEMNNVTYLPIARGEIPAAILERELNEGSPSQRALAEEIIILIGRQIGEDLSRGQTNTVKFNVTELSARLFRKTRQAASNILSLTKITAHPQKWERLRTALILQRAINQESGGQVQLTLSSREQPTAVTPMVFVSQEGKNVFDNISLPLSSSNFNGQEPFIIYSLVAGKGQQLGLLSVQNTKPDTQVFGRKMVDYSRDFILRFFPSDSQDSRLDSGWVIVAVGDNFFLPEEQDNTFIKQLSAQLKETEASFIYFDMLPENRSQNFFCFGWPSISLVFLNRLHALVSF